MDLRFVLTLTEHRILGFVFAPYFIRREGQDQYNIYDRVTLQNIQSYKSILNPEEQQIIKLIEEYNDQILLKLFCKKKITSREFIASIDEELLEKHIRPYIDRRMEKCVDILKYNPIPIYQKILHNSIYESDKLKLVDEEGNTLFNFIRDNDGLRYYLSIVHNGKELMLKGSDGIVVVNHPCFLILNNHLFIFRDINGRKLIPFLDKDFISIPKQTEKKYLESFVRNTIRDFNVKVSGINIDYIDSRPKPLVSLETDLTGRTVLILKFAYENAIYNANEYTKPKVTCNFKGNEVSFRVLKRDLEFENNHIASLLSLGLKNEAGPYFIPFIKSKDKQERQGYHVINWLNFNKQLLNKHQFEISQDRLDKKYYLDNLDLKIEITDKENDWFDIEAYVIIEGERIPFIKFKDHIAEGNREYVLPDGRIVVLPEEWFEKYGDILKFSRVVDNNLKLDKKHFSLLDKKAWKAQTEIKEKLSGLFENNIKQTEQVPVQVNAELRSYQQEGYTWMYRLYENGFGGCLADDMGLGKTLQTLTLLRRIKNESGTANNKNVMPVELTQQLTLFGGQAQQKTVQTSLIIVPTSLVHNWLNEIHKFIPDLKTTTYIGASRGNLNTLCQENDLIVTSYGILRNDIDKFINFAFLYVILDESQMIKNPTSKTYASVLKLQSDYRLVLTGTPIENALTDLWAQMNFLNPGLLGSMAFFKHEFQLPIEKQSDQEKQQKLKQIIAPFVLRRTKTQVAKELPELAEQVVYCDLHEQQELLYEREKSKARNFVFENIGKLGLNKAKVLILQSLTKLRQIANHPVMVDQDYLSRSGKFDEIVRNLDSLASEGHKALIFSSFVKHLDLVAGHLDKTNTNYAYLTGQTQKREKEIEKFQNGDNCPFFLISLKAGGVGLNLTAADYVFILDPWWNPAAEMQAISRAHRIGQEKHVMVYRFITRNTLEEKIIKLQRKKADLADMFINQNNLKGINKEEIMELFE